MIPHWSTRWEQYCLQLASSGHIKTGRHQQRILLWRQWSRTVVNPRILGWIQSLSSVLLQVLIIKPRFKIQQGKELIIKQTFKMGGSLTTVTYNMHRWCWDKTYPDKINQHKIYWTKYTRTKRTEQNIAKKTYMEKAYRTISTGQNIPDKIYQHTQYILI